MKTQCTLGEHAMTASLSATKVYCSIGRAGFNVTDENKEKERSEQRDHVVHYFYECYSVGWASWS